MSERKARRPGATIMVQGTSSDAGKSLLTTALCRILMQDGLSVAPFKSQNMSLNSYVTWDGKEIGRAQGVQADACRIPATTDMNPILLKPTGNMSSQVVVHGRPLRVFGARAYREQFLGEAEQIVKDALNRLRASHDVIVLEGAGSPAEINLKDRDIVNMRMAGWADAPVLLVADIDRGGVFASIVGTMEILEPHERARVAGFVINKFRGDVALLQPGLEWLERRTGKPVLGVIPYLPDLGLEDEDSLSLDARRRTNAAGGTDASPPAAGAPVETGGDRLDIAVIRLPHISNFTDIDPLHYEPDVSVRYIEEASAFGRPDAVIIPGSKNTVEDLLHLRTAGYIPELEQYRRSGGFIVGICGGYEMMGSQLLDPWHVESDRDATEGLGWFPFRITFEREKRTVRVEGRCDMPGLDGVFAVAGYEIHMGRINFDAPAIRPFALQERVVGQQSGLVGQNDGQLGESRPEGVCDEDGRIWGTFVHGILHNDSLRRAWLNRIRRAIGREPLPETLRFLERREAAFDRLADHVRRYLDMARVRALIGLEDGSDRARQSVERSK